MTEQLSFGAVKSFEAAKAQFWCCNRQQTTAPLL